MSSQELRECHTCHLQPSAFALEDGYFIGCLNCDWEYGKRLEDSRCYHKTRATATRYWQYYKIGEEPPKSHWTYCKE